jgi:hypothetical protein
VAEIRWTNEAEQWLKDIYDYIAQDSPSSAFRIPDFPLDRNCLWAGGDVVVPSSSVETSINDRHRIDLSLEDRGALRAFRGKEVLQMWDLGRRIEPRFRN